MVYFMGCSTYFCNNMAIMASSMYPIKVMICDFFFLPLVSVKIRVIFPFQWKFSLKGEVPPCNKLISEE